MPAGVSNIADHVSVAGVLLAVGDPTTSPPTYTPVCNVSDLAVPIAATEVLVTNVSDTWVRRVPTLLDMGKVTFSIFWVMTEPTHANLAGPPTGMRYLLMNRILAAWQITYPETATTPPVDAFTGYVTSFQITGKVGDVFKATCGIGTTGTPTLC
jgi:hypothetical protein